jgi:hypothetical protein
MISPSDCIACGVQEDLRPATVIFCAVDPAERRELDPQQLFQRRALPVVLHQQIVLWASAWMQPRKRTSNSRCRRSAARSCAQP